MTSGGDRPGGDAGALRCPSCGAPAAPGAARCAFCRTRLATVSCPSCFALMFAGAIHCHACGARRGRRSTRQAAEASCPACRAPLHGVAVGATSLLECDRCDGVWVDADAFERLCAEAAIQTAILHQYPATTIPEVQAVRYRPCARCGRLMNRINFGRVSGVIVEVCKGHGTFLDPGELHRIVEFIREGGLDRARARQIEELRHREQAVKRAEARLARERGRGGQPARRGRLSTWHFLVGGTDRG
jgi:Zn-finger nucleic acid-binding protein